MDLNWKTVYEAAAKENPKLFAALEDRISEYVSQLNEVTSNDAGRDILGKPWPAKPDWDKLLFGFSSSLFGQAMYEALKNGWNVEDRKDRKGKVYTRKQAMPSGR
jgi:hypothetical protein